jgi:hypothetical protein
MADNADRDGREPAPDGLGVPQGADSPRSFYEHVLHQVIDLGVTAGELQDDRGHVPAVPSIYRIEGPGRLLSPDEAQHNLSLVSGSHGL